MGGDASNGGAGNARGGGVLVDDGTTATLDNSDVHDNRASGGGGTDGGDGLGGGIYVGNAATATVTRSKIRNNRALGGAGHGGLVGDGIGGGVYVLGILFVDAATQIDHNAASTSNDNVFGPLVII